MNGPRVLLTGAFGNVGSNTLIHAVGLGQDVHAFDIDTPANRSREQALAAEHRFTTHWGDLRNSATVQRVVHQARPEVVLHVAAVIAPHAFVNPELAEQVNVGGTVNLLSALTRLDDPARFVLTSSITVHGPRNPHRNLPPLTGSTPVAPADNYACHKALAEALVAESGLSWSVLRLPAVMPTDPRWGTDPVFLKFFFLLPPDRREHLLDSRDAGLALANAVTADSITGRAWDLGGPEVDCRVIAIDFHRRGMEALGLSPMREHVFRRAHPEVDESWYAEDWVDTTPSQAVLSYQQNTFADHLEFKRSQAGASYYAMRVMAPLVRQHLENQSPYRRRPAEPDATPLWDVIRETFELDARSGPH